jgi:2-keto-4-pentenoate hydratase/2-oxohepta-3-ene-1,7-dioic acid hydratase in catechol pathway
MASTRDMVFTVPQLIAFIASIMTLEPGDVILTGTPAGVGDLMPGVSVSITIEGLGTLTNPVLGEG